MLVSRLHPGVLGGTAPSTNSGKFEANGYDVSLTWHDKMCIRDRINTTFRSTKKPMSVEVNDKKIPVVYQKSQIKVKL